MAERVATRKPTTPKPSKLRTAAEALRDAKRIRAAKAAEQLRASPTQAVHEMRDGVLATELHGIRRKLKLAQSCSQVLGAALRDQNCGLDSDAADILATHVTDALHIQIMKIDRLLGHDVDEDDIDEDEEDIANRKGDAP
jgi:hypothetical protein